MSFARGDLAWYICDCCGFRYYYKDRKKTSYGTIVCDTCFDGEYDLKNHPQNFPPPISEDPQGLEEPRPDVYLATIGVSYYPSLTRSM